MNPHRSRRYDPKQKHSTTDPRWDKFSCVERVLGYVMPQAAWPKLPLDTSVMLRPQLIDMSARPIRMWLPLERVPPAVSD
jgi:hypothetical protein